MKTFKNKLLVLTALFTIANLQASSEEENQWNLFATNTQIVIATVGVASGYLTSNMVSLFASRAQCPTVATQEQRKKFLEKAGRPTATSLAAAFWAGAVGITTGNFGYLVGGALGGIGLFKVKETIRKYYFEEDICYLCREQFPNEIDFKACSNGHKLHEKCYAELREANYDRCSCCQEPFTF